MTTRSARRGETMFSRRAEIAAPAAMPAQENPHLAVGESPAAV
jgi:hypothetical protein